MLNLGLVYDKFNKIDYDKNAITPCVVAGNAPSLKAIDYTRLPLSYDTFRCNQFYFEDKYYLGKDIKAVSFANQALFQQIYTMCVLNQKDEYRIESIFLRNGRYFGCECAEHEANMQNLLKVFTQNCFIHRIYDGLYSQNIAKFLEYLSLNAMYNYAHPTTGILLCGVAIALGYREIYIAGIDFYSTKEAYAFNAEQKNILIFDTGASNIIKPTTNELEKMYHNKAFDLECLEFLSKHYSVKFYSLCPLSPLSQYIPLANITHNAFSPPPKPQDFINDVQIPPQIAYMQFFAPSYKKTLAKNSGTIGRIKKMLGKYSFYRKLRDLIKTKLYASLFSK